MRRHISIAESWSGHCPPVVRTLAIGPDPSALMAGYRSLVPQANRWAIVAFVRTLERRRLAGAAGAGID